jgi:dynein heavy chain
MTRDTDQDANNVAIGVQLCLYEDLGSFGDVKKTMESLMGLYNTVYKPLNLVFFEDALEHITRILRTITLPQGNSLLVGVGGSGKQSLARLAAFTAQAVVLEITLSRGYDETAFRTDLKVCSMPSLCSCSVVRKSMEMLP